jgi:hypothetical protein
MRHIYNFRKFSINETRLILESLDESPIKLTPDEHREIGIKINNWLTKNPEMPNVLYSLMRWVCRDSNVQGIDFPTEWTASSGSKTSFKNKRKWPDEFDKESFMWDAVKKGFTQEQFATASDFRNWVYFLGCTLNNNHPSYDALRTSMRRPQGQFQSKKTPHLISLETSFDDERKMTEIVLLDDRGFEELIKVCQEIVAKSGIEKEVNVETNTNPRSPVETPNQNQDMAPNQDIAPNQDMAPQPKNIKTSGPKSRPKPKKPTKQVRTFRT